MEKLQEQVTTIIAPWILRISDQKHIQAIKLSMISSMPFFIVWGFLLCFTFVLKRYHPTLDISTMMRLYSIFTLVIQGLIAYETGANLASSYHIAKTMGGMLALISCASILYSQASVQIQLEDMIISTYFPSLLLSLLSVEVYRLGTKLSIKLNKVPQAVGDYIQGLIPLFLVMALVVIVVFLPNGWLMTFTNFMNCIVSICDSMLVVALSIATTCFFWIFGIHGVAVIGSILRPFWMYMLLANALAYINGSPLPYISGEGFYQWFVWIGGSGTTIGLVLMMKYVAKSKHLRSIGQDASLSTIFNINEPVIFGTPIALNPYMMLPFILVPLIAGTINYLLIQNGYVQAIWLMAPWIFPAPLGAFIASGGYWNVLLAVLVTLVLSFVLYVPFFIAYDKKMRKEECLCEH